MDISKPGQPNPIEHFWKLLYDMEPEMVSENSLCKYDSKREFFTVPVFSEVFRVFKREKKVVSVAFCGENANETPVGFKEMGFEFFLVLLGYLTGAKNIPLTGEWVSEKDIKGGETFFRGPHVALIEPIVKRFESSLDSFSETGNRLGGKREKVGDMSFVFHVFPRVPLLYALWGRDEEFGGRAQILFDSSIEAQMPLDLIWAMTRFCTKKIVSTSQ